MIEHPNLLRVLPTAVLVIFLLAGETLQQARTKNIILIDKEDVIVSVLEGNSFDVKCSYLGTYVTIDFQWKKIINNRWTVRPSNETLSSSQWLYFENPQWDDEGLYSCSINGFDGINKFSKKLYFNLETNPFDKFNSYFLQPKFYSHTMENNVPFLVNSTLHLSCPFTSSGDTEFSWFKNDELLIKRKAIAIANSYGHVDNEYSLNLVKLSDAGYYRCVVSNAHSSILHNFAVVVYVDLQKMPRDVQYPISQSLRSGETAHFYCETYGKDLNTNNNWYYLNCTNPMDIDIQTVDLSQFKKMETNFNVEVENTKLILKNITIYDAGWYICVMRGLRKMLMAEAKLDVDKVMIPVRVDLSLPTTFIEIGSDLTIDCLSDGYPTPTVTWYKDGQILLNNNRTQVTDNKLVLFRTNISDLGSYKCEAYNSYNSSEKTVNITIHDPVRVNNIIALANTTITIGSYLSIACLVDGYPTPTVTWYKDGQILRNNDRILATKNKFVLLNTNISDTGSYKCKAYNSYSSDEKTVDITMHVPVGVDILLPTTNNAIGSDLTIYCSSDGYPTPTVTWYKDGQILLNNNRTQVTENKLVLFRTNSSDSGSYKCKADNSYSSNEKTVNITIHDPVQVNNIIALPNTTITIGSYVSIACLVDGYPTPTVNWYKDGQILRNNDRILATKDKFVLLNTNISDTGSYKCKAYNSYSSDEKTVDISIHDPVRIIDTALLTTTIPIGSFLDIPCLVDGYPTPNVTWYKDGQILLNDSRILAAVNHLAVLNLSALDTGLYKCEAQNLYSFDNKIINITVQSIPVSDENENYTYKENLLGIIFIMAVFVLTVCCLINQRKKNKKLKGLMDLNATLTEKIITLQKQEITDASESLIMSGAQFETQQREYMILDHIPESEYQLPTNFTNQRVQFETQQREYMILDHIPESEYQLPTNFTNQRAVDRPCEFSSFGRITWRRP